MPSAIPSSVPVAAGRLDDLARQHVARWLSAALPLEGCALVVARDTVLAQALAAGGRAVALATPTEALAEVAATRCGSSIAVTWKVPADPGPLSSAVIVLAGSDDVVDAVGLVDKHLRPGGSLVVLAPPELAEQALTAVQATGRRVHSHPQVVRAASCLGVGESGLVASQVGGPDEALLVSVVVIAGDVQPQPDALLGHDMGPAAWRSATAELVTGLQQAQRQHDELRPASEQLGQVRAQLLDAEQELAVLPELEARAGAAEARVQELEHQLSVSQAAATRHAERVAELLSSTSWKVAAPLRAVSDRFHRR